MIETFFNEIIKKEDFRLYSEMPIEDLEYIISVVNNTDEKLLKNAEGFSFLGSGYFGTVYSYKNYAIKLLHYTEDLISQDELCLSLVRNLKTYPELYAGSKFFIVEELVNGKTLKDCESIDYANIKKSNINTFVNDLVETLKSELNPHDVHEENIMLCEDGTFKIVDVGNFEKTEFAYKVFSKCFNDFNLKQLPFYDFTIQRCITCSAIDLIKENVDFSNLNQQVA